ncbi:MAG: hypothetical protein K2L07_04860 [Lachnospiraceae bacterium]|nr:hypothetical protein [Lachnospiraceae bacterium]
MARLAKRNNKEPRNPTKKVEDIKVGDIVVVNNFQFQVYKIDNVNNKVCLVDKYACDYNFKKGDTIEIIS